MVRVCVCVCLGEGGSEIVRYATCVNSALHKLSSSHGFTFQTVALTVCMLLSASSFFPSSFFFFVAVFVYLFPVKLADTSVACCFTIRYHVDCLQIILVVIYECVCVHMISFPYYLMLF